MTKIVDIGTRIRRMRENRGIKMVDFADQLGVHLASISKLENNKKPLSLKLLIDISQVLGVSIDEILGTSSGFAPGFGDNVRLPVYDEIIIEDGKIKKSYHSDHIVPTEILDGMRCFYFLIPDDALAGIGIYKNDLVMIEENSKFENGDIMLVAAEGYGTELRKIFLHDDVIFIQSLCTSKVDYKVVGEHRRLVKFIGKLKKVERNIK